MPKALNFSTPHCRQMCKGARGRPNGLGRCRRPSQDTLSVGGKGGPQPISNLTMILQQMSMAKLFKSKLFAIPRNNKQLMTWPLMELFTSNFGEDARGSPSRSVTRTACLMLGQDTLSVGGKGGPAADLKSDDDTASKCQWQHLFKSKLFAIASNN